MDQPARLGQWSAATAPLEGCEPGQGECRPKRDQQTDSLPTRPVAKLDVVTSGRHRYGDSGVVSLEEVDLGAVDGRRPVGLKGVRDDDVAIVG